MRNDHSDGYAYQDDNIGRNNFKRINRSQLQQWAEAVSDDEALGTNEKAYALKLVGEYSDSVDGENVAEEFCDPEDYAASLRRVAVGRLIDCGYIRVLWTREYERRAVFGIVLGWEARSPREGEAA
jgi:hypothetical protein